MMYATLDLSVGKAEGWSSKTSEHCTNSAPDKAHMLQMPLKKTEVGSLWRCSWMDSMLCSWRAAISCSPPTVEVSCWLWCCMMLACTLSSSRSGSESAGFMFGQIVLAGLNPEAYWGRQSIYLFFLLFNFYLDRYSHCDTGSHSQERPGQDNNSNTTQSCKQTGHSIQRQQQNTTHKSDKCTRAKDPHRRSLQIS